MKFKGPEKVFSDPGYSTYAESEGSYVARSLFKYLLTLHRLPLLDVLILNDLCLTAEAWDFANCSPAL